MKSVKKKIMDQFQRGQGIVVAKKLVDGVSAR